MKAPGMMAYMRCLVLWTFFMRAVQSCPEPCICTDKYAHQFTDCAYKDLQVVPEGLPSNVTTLSLTANKIKSLLKNSFVNVTQVTSLWLAHNEIVTIEKGTLAVLVQLRNLDLSYNQIAHFPWEDLYNLTALQLLKMNNNHMVNLPKDAFSTLKDLRSLRINNNRFTSILQGTFDSLSSMSHLQIYNNPFSCTCTLYWLKDWIEGALISIPEQEYIVCESPEDFKGIQISKLPKLQCVPPSVSISTQPSLDSTVLVEGMTLTFHCNTSGSPKPEVKWNIRTGGQNIQFNLPLGHTENHDLPLEDSQNTATRFLVFKNGTLIVPHISKRDNGSYVCSAKNDQGSKENTVKVAVAGIGKGAVNTMQERIFDKNAISEGKSGVNVFKNHAISLPDSGITITDPTKATYSVATERGGAAVASGAPVIMQKCGIRDRTEYISNHAFNQSTEDQKRHTFDFGVIALEVSETEAKVQLTALQTSVEKPHLEMLYLCVDAGNGHSLVQWSKIEAGVNAYQFQGLHPGTNYTLCLTYTGEDCQVQVVFTTRRKVPSLLIIVVVSTFLLAIATVPLLGATCCHLLYKYQGKTYKLIMKTQNPDQMEKHMVADFDPRASYADSEKNYNASEMGETAGDGEEVEGEIEADESIVNESIPGSQSKTNQEEFEVGSEYSDRLPLGAEAVNISPEINGNYKQSGR
ncbi:immunoglobulin superfamily containing leucine-rich repeat protein 2 [Polypterus senegalus]|uniref:immunoglobulin superfamily containing leucine-rich repeat protein 2 n=1 Tax=Polypterus senegalus TaxID=55291 RepID=UPI00196273AC|nr:immunoglobulin superfamily containing leucine-rich repeat protein 2 [Polypterus senegalus]